jgi:hypothetical protein
MYYELWIILCKWKTEFTVKEFSKTFISPNPNKILYDMTKKGMLDRIGWGIYRVNSPEEYLKIKNDIKEGYEFLKQIELIYSLTGPDAVYIWTKGGYQVNRFFGFYPIHLKVKSINLKDWIQIFDSEKKKYFIKGNPIKETLFGVFYIIYRSEKINYEEIDGFHVDNLKETVRFCKDKIYTYKPALEMLDEIYDLGLNVEYKEIKTNF